MPDFYVYVAVEGSRVFHVQAADKAEAEEFVLSGVSGRVISEPDQTYVDDVIEIVPH